MPSRVKLIAADCLQAMRSLPDACCDLICADLPYGKTQNAWDRVIPIEPMFSEFRRIARPAAPTVLLAAQPFASRLICANEDEFRYDLIWRKNKSTGFLNAKRQPLRNHEHLLVFYREQPIYNPQKTQGHVPGHKATRAKASSNYGAHHSTDYGGNTDRYPLSVLDVPIMNNDSPDKTHPTQKPVELMEWIIRTFTNEEHVVLDPTMGVGTTGIACCRQNRHFIGIELKPEYAEMAERRIRDYTTPSRTPNVKP